VARATQAWPAFYGYTLALYVAVVLGRIHEAIPFVARLYLGKTSALVLVAAAVMQVPGRDFARLFKTTAARCLMVITGIGILSVPTSYWPSQSLGFFQNQWPQTLLLFGCVAVGVQYRRVAMACIIALTATTGLAALSFVLGGGADVNGRVFIGNALSQTYDPNQSAALFVTTLPYVVLLASRKGKLRWLAIPLIPLFVSALLKDGFARWSRCVRNGGGCLPRRCDQETAKGVSHSVSSGRDHANAPAAFEPAWRGSAS
jgi:hypothetical protein